MKGDKNVDLEKRKEIIRQLRNAATLVADLMENSKTDKEYMEYDNLLEEIHRPLLYMRRHFPAN